MTHLEVWAPDGMPEVRPGDDLAALVLAACSTEVPGGTGLRDGDVVSLTSKVVSKAEGRVRVGDREEAIDEESTRVVARRGPTRIVRHRLGLTMAAAGVDASNVEEGSIVLLPLDPDASARALRRALLDRAGVNVGVVVTDTAGRAWREGQTDIAIGAAGILVAEDFAGRVDGYGNALAVTLPAVADELAGAAELTQGKLGGRPVAVLRGRADLVLPPGEDGPGARSLVRPESGDMFGWGAREAVVRALAGDDDDRLPFGARASAEELAAALARLPQPADPTAVAAVRFAHGWRPGDLPGARPDGSDCDGSPPTT